MDPLLILKITQTSGEMPTIYYTPCISHGTLYHAPEVTLLPLTAGDCAQLKKALIAHLLRRAVTI